VVSGRGDGGWVGVQHTLHPADKSFAHHFIPQTDDRPMRLQMVIGISRTHCIHTIYSLISNVLDCNDSCNLYSCKIAELAPAGTR
jgi:hypothetical protein